MSQTTLPSDNTDEESILIPLKWDVREFSKYIIVFGIVSSVFDFLTFYLLYGVLKLSGAHFQTGWFIESIATQILIIFIIRTKRVPFFKSIPSVYIIASAIGVVLLAWVLPYTLFGALFSFVALPGIALIAIFGIVLVYLMVGETVKYFFYRRFVNAP